MARRALALTLAVAGLTLFLVPAHAHVSTKPNHLWTKHLRPLADARYLSKGAGIPWTSVSGVPSGFADGTDADSGGDITGVTAGTGLTGGGSTGGVTLGIDFTSSGGDNGTGTTAARGDHVHDARYYSETELQTSGSSSVHWNNLTSVPAGFADGVDNTGGTASDLNCTACVTGSELEFDPATQTELDALSTDDSAINETGDPVHWTKLKGVPAAIADGTDADSGGDITGVTAGTGLTGGGSTGGVTLGIDFTSSGGDNGTGTTAARGDHVHDARYYSETELQTNASASVHWGNLTNVPAGFADGTDDTGGTASDLSCTACVTESELDFGVATQAELDSHASSSAHDGRYYTESELNSDDSTINETGDPVHWTKLKGVPAGFADGTDAVDGGQASDLACSSCVAPSELTFDPATQGELDSHATSSTSHDNRYYTETELQTSGSANVHWGNLTSVPTGLADGDDRIDPRPGFALTAIDSAGSVGHYVSAVVGADGLPFMAHTALGSPGLRVTHCDDLACTTATSRQVVAGPSPQGTFPSVAIGQDGLPIIAYQNTSARLAVVHCTNVACSANDTPTQLESVNITGQGTSIAIGVDGFALIAYYYESNKDLRVVHCTNVTCSTFDAPVTLDSSGLVGSDGGIAIGTDGLGVISYIDESNDRVKVAHCDNVACSTATLVTVDALTAGGARSSITIGRDGFPLVAFFRGPTDEIRIADCDNAGCTGVATTTLVEVGHGDGGYVSISIAPDGIPMVAFMGTGADLKVARCADLDCGTVGVKTLVDAANDVGLHTALIMGADGLPLIPYFDRTNLDLRVAHCSNVFCTPYFRPR